MQVTHPTAGNIGGGGFLVFMNAVGMVTTIDFREKAPLTASPNMFLDSKGQLIHESNHETLLAVGVPGTVAGLYLAHQKYGTLAWKELVQPAVNLAQKGFIMPWGLYLDALELIASEPSNDFIKNYFNNAQGK